MPESLKITPNGHLLYASSNGVGDGTTLYQLTILGTSSLALTPIPVARFTATRLAGTTLSFDAGASVPATHHETLVTYAWDFGDGTTGAAKVVRHRFAGPGPYLVRLTVTSSTGLADTASTAVLGGSISGTVFNDVNGDGLRNGGERGLAGWTVFLDADQNGSLDPGEATAVTAADGSYVFPALAGGVIYHVGVVLPAGWQLTTAAEIDVPLSPGGKVTRVAVGVAALPMISGTVAHDFDGTTIDDLPLQGWTVYLIPIRNGQVAGPVHSTTTAADGRYAFTRLTPWVEYHVRLALPGGWLAATPTTLDVVALDGQNSTGNNFRVALPAALSGNVFSDANADGRREAGEAGLAGWTVTLTASAGFGASPVSVRTDGRGNFHFTGVAPGTYTLALVVKAGWKPLLPAGGARTIVVTSGEGLTGLDDAVERLLNPSP